MMDCSIRAMRKSVEERSRSISSKNFVVGRHFRSGHPEVANQALTSMKQVHFTHCRSSKYWHFSQISIRFLKISGVTVADLPAILTAAALDSSKARRNGDFQLICIVVDGESIIRTCQELIFDGASTQATHLQRDLFLRRLLEGGPWFGIDPRYGCRPSVCRLMACSSFYGW